MRALAKSVAIAVLTVLMSGPALAAAGLPSAQPVARQTSVPERATSPVASPVAAPNAGDYAARERNAKELEGFVGGHGGLYIGGGAVTVLLVILLVLLLV